MSVHFAAARSRARSPLARIIGNARAGRPANDEPAADVPFIDEATEVTLRHFAEYGLGAAKAALARAGEARRNGDQARAHYWLEICNRLDRQAAVRFERSNETLIG